MYTLIIVDYNSLENTINYVNHCKQQLGITGAGHVIIIENGTENNCQELLQGHFGPAQSRTIQDSEVLIFQDQWQQIAFCKAKENLGYARGNNLGIRLAEAIWNDPFYIISNNDLLFREPLDLHIPKELFLTHPEIGVIGPSVITPTGTSQSPRKWQSAFHRLILNTWVGACGAFLPAKSYQKLSEKYCDDTVKNAQTGPCAWVSGCFMFLRAEAMKKIELFDENTFLYAEEMILSRRMEKAGCTVWFCRELVVVHNHAQTTKKALSVLKMRQLDYQANRYYFKTYEHTSPLCIAIANCNFAIYESIFKLWQKIKESRKHTKEDGTC